MAAAGIVIAAVLAGCSDATPANDPPETPDGPLVPSVSLKYAAADRGAAAEAAAQCRTLGKTAHPAAPVPNSAAAQVFNCQ